MAPSPRGPPLVMSGAAPAATTCFKRLASLLSEKWDQSYSSTLAWLRCKLSFALLRSSIQCLWGARSAAGRPSRNVLLPVDLVLSEAGFYILIFPFVLCWAFYIVVSCLVSLRNGFDNIIFVREKKKKKK